MILNGPRNFLDNFLDGQVVWINLSSMNTKSSTWIFGAGDHLASAGPW